MNKTPYISVNKKGLHNIHYEALKHTIIDYLRHNFQRLKLILGKTHQRLFTRFNICLQ